MEWSGQQEGAIVAVKEWLKDKENKLFYMAGYAGTGKTTLAKEVASDVSDVLYGAFTGKAASVMRRKGCRNASTIHSMIYKLTNGNDETPTFELNRDSDVKSADLVIIDECSMVDEEIGRDLLSFGTKVLVLGDPAQLPPVKGAGFFTSREPDIMLTEVHRQARDNPIIAMSMAVREGRRLELGAYGESRVISRNGLIPDDVLNADQIIVGLNRTRHLYNKRIRTLLGRESQMPEKGDKLVCLRNDKIVGIFNGSLWEAQSVGPCFVAARKKKRSTPIILEDRLSLALASIDEEGREKGVVVRKEFFLGAESDIPWQEKRGTQEFTYGYALTCHKSQGSQFPNVVVFDEGNSFREDAWRWRYTAITRAAEKITVVVGG